MSTLKATAHDAFPFTMTTTDPPMDQVVALPPEHAGTAWRHPQLELPAIAACLRHEHAPVFDVWMKTTASRGHRLQDGAMAVGLPKPLGCFASVSDAATHSKGIAAEDATHSVMQAELAQLRDQLRLRDGLMPAHVLQAVDARLRELLLTLPQARTAVAHSIVVVDADGRGTLAAVGDAPALLLRQRRHRLQRDRVQLLTRLREGDGRKLAGALGQRTDRPLQIDQTTFRMARGDVLLMGSDGGLPAPLGEDLHKGLRLFFQDRRAGRLTTLAELGEALDARARRVGAYDDDRTLLLIERL